MKKEVNLKLNYFAAVNTNAFNELMKEEFYEARKQLFNMGYAEYVEEKALPISPKDQNIFYPLATYRVKDDEGNFDWFNIYAKALGGMIISNEL